ncbi:MAG: hypothetical protein BWZ09_02352 [Alphaproteobacteria bacterium ADurb.BinA305]|nr:MAG: hypothetical protein BWZ09_02352 [Alphaproteobacteria bacterium ADurb.BinA305]
MDPDLRLGMHAGVVERLDQRLVRLGKVHVLADETDIHGLLRVLERVDEPVPHREVGRAREDVELVADDLVEHLVMQLTGDLVDRVGVQALDDRLGHDVAEQRDLAALVFRHRTVGAAQQDVGLDADLAQLLHRVLGRLGLQFTGGRNVGQQREVDEAGAVAALFEAHLADGLQEGQRFDVAHRAADLDDRHVGALGATLDVSLDLVSDVRDDLHGLAQVLAAALLLQHRLVDLAGGEVVALAHLGAGEALVMAEVEVGLGAVFGDEDLAVLERAHGARIDVDVGVQLEVRDLDAAGLEDRPEGRCGDALAQGGHDTTGDEDVFGHGSCTAGKRDDNRCTRTASAVRVPPARSLRPCRAARAAAPTASPCRSSARCGFRRGAAGSARAAPRHARARHSARPRCPRPRARCAAPRW